MEIYAVMPEYTPVPETFFLLVLSIWMGIGAGTFVFIYETPEFSINDHAGKIFFLTVFSAMVLILGMFFVHFLLPVKFSNLAIILLGAQLIWFLVFVCLPVWLQSRR